MPTLANLKSKIASDLHRSDLTTPISDAVTSAILHYNRENFWFLQGRADTTLSAGQAFYDVPYDFGGTDSLLVTISGSRTPLDGVTYSSIDEADTGQFTGQPFCYAYYQDNFRFYPAPDGEYVVTMSYHKKLEEPSNSGSNSWTSDAYDLIKYRAEWELYSSHLRNFEMAQIMKNSEMEALSSMLRENGERFSTGRIVRSGW